MLNPSLPTIEEYYTPFQPPSDYSLVNALDEADDSECVLHSS